MYLKRQETPKNWPVRRKGTAYIVKPSSNTQNGIPMLVIVRDILKIAQNRGEVKKAINSKKILLNGKKIKDEKNPALLFDIISIVPSKKNYRLEISETGKFMLNEIKEANANQKIAKIINKKMLKGKKVQINLSDGRNFLSDKKYNINDSVIVNFKEKKMEKLLPFEEKAKVFVFEGKHAGKKGVIKKIIEKNKMAEIDIKDRNINVLIKQLMVVE